MSSDPTVTEQDMVNVAKLAEQQKNQGAKKNIKIDF